METGTVKLWDFSKPIKERHAGPCGPYYFNRGPLRDKGDKMKGFGGYLSADGTEINEGSMLRLRVVKAEENYSRASEWYCDDDCDQTMYGIVTRLPHGRGFFAGWTMGEGMCCSFDGHVYDSIEDASRAADSEAESAAENEREYQREERERDDQQNEEAYG